MLYARLKIGKDKSINLVPWFFLFFGLYVWLAWDILRSIYEVIWRFYFDFTHFLF